MFSLVSWYLLPAVILRVCKSFEACCRSRIKAAEALKHLEHNCVNTKTHGLLCAAAQWTDVVPRLKPLATTPIPSLSLKAETASFVAR